MQLSPVRFNALLNGLGQLTGLRRAHDCPCRDEHSGAARPDCPACAGIGVIWDAAVDAMVALAGQKVQRGWAQFGFYEQGDVVLTLPSDSPAYDMGERDRVVFLQSTTPFSVTRTRTGAEKLDFPVATVEAVLWLDGNGLRVDGGLPAVAADGSLTWASGAPPAQTQYSITGRRRPEYFCWGDFPQDRAHHGGRTLPRRVVLRRFDLFGRQQ
jgi:hypothetical protein